jgi:hypothetical protein
MPNYDINPNLAGKLPAEGIAHLKQLLSLDQVTNTTAAAVNAATQSALNLKANLASPNFSGVPTLAGAPLATQAWVGTQVSGVITRTAEEGSPHLTKHAEEWGLDSNPDNGDTLVVSIPEDEYENTWTFVTGPPGLSEIQIGVDVVETRANIVGTIDEGVTSTLVGDKVVFESSYSGAYWVFELTGTAIGDHLISEGILAQGGGIAASSVGQRCIVGDEGAGDDLGNGNYLEFTSYDGETWELSGPSGVVENEDAPGTYKKLEFTNGQPVYAPYSILA